MIPVILIVSGLGLLAFPAWARPIGRRLPPREWSLLGGLALAGGTLAVETALVLLAAPTVLRAIQVPALAAACERMLGRLSPGGAPVGWMSGAIAVLIAIMAARGILRARRTYEAVRAEPWLGQHVMRPDYELVVIPSPQLLAVSVAGARPQVILSAGLVEMLSDEEFDAVLRHEAAHLQHGHQRYLLLATAVDAGFFFFPFVRGSTAALRIALERWADEVAAGESVSGRAKVRAALLTMSHALLAAELAAFSTAESVIERVQALETSPTAQPVLGRSVVYLPTVVLGTVATLAVAVWVRDAHTVLAMSGLCSM